MLPGPGGFRTRPPEQGYGLGGLCGSAGSRRAGPTCSPSRSTSHRATGAAVAACPRFSAPRVVPGRRWPEARFRSSPPSSPWAPPGHPKGRGAAEEPRSGLTRRRPWRSRRPVPAPFSRCLPGVVRPARPDQGLGVVRPSVPQHGPRRARVLVRQRHRRRAASPPPPSGCAGPRDPPSAAAPSAPRAPAACPGSGRRAC